MKKIKKQKLNIWSYLRKDRKLIISMLCLLLVAVLLGRLVTYLNTYLVDNAIVAQNLSLLFGVGGAIVGILIIEVVCMFIQSKVICNLGYNIASKMRKDLYEKVMFANYQYFEENKVAGILSRTSTYINDLGDFVTKNLVPFLTNLLKFVTVFIFMFALNAILGAIILGVLLVVLFTVFIIGKISAKRNKAYRKAEIERDAQIMDSVFGLTAIVLNNGQNQKLQEFDEVQQENVRSWNKFSRINELFLPLVEGIWFLGIVAVYIFAFYKMGSVGFEIGAVISFISYITQTNEPIKQSALNYQSFINIVGTINKIFEILKIDTSRRKVRVEKIEEEKPNIEIKNISFKHKYKHAHISNFSLDIEYGKKIAIVGERGSGKTTLAYLLARIYSPDSGKILVGGKDIQFVEKGQFESVVSIISSRPYIFEQSVRENLLLGKSDVSDIEIFRVLSMCGLDDEVEAFKGGLDEKLRDNGSAFSSGEKQMISLARVMLKNPSIIIFDGVFNFADASVKKEMFRIVKNFAKDKTCIFLCSEEDELPFECEKINL